MIPEVFFDSLTEDQEATIMEAVQVGIQHGLDIAEARLRGEIIEPLSWSIVRSRLRRDGD